MGRIFNLLTWFLLTIMPAHLDEIKRLCVEVQFKVVMLQYVKSGAIIKSCCFIQIRSNFSQNRIRPETIFYFLSKFSFKFKLEPMVFPRYTLLLT